MTQVTDRPEKYVGGGVPRKEDPELLTGQAKFIDDMVIPGMLWVYVVRSPMAHARINSVDVSRAAQMPGVVAAFSGADLASDWADSMPCAWPVTEDIKLPKHWPVAQDKARYAGDAVAVVVADSRARAKDAAEAVEVDYDMLDVVLDLEEATQDTTLIHDDLGTNTSYKWTLANGEVDKVFGDAPVVVKERYRHPRLIPNAIEPRGVLVQPSPAQGEFTVYSATQIPHIAKVLFSLVLGIPESKMRVVAPTVGGGFGSKLNIYGEELICMAVARKLGKPVKWIEERSEGYLATIHGRDLIQDMEIAATEEGKVLGVRANLLANMGSYLQLVTPGIPLLGAFLYHGVYQAEAYAFECTGVFTNTTPTDAYRGAGRPEATYAIERTMDALAREVGKDPVEIRRINFLPAFTEPVVSPGGLKLDSGDYHATLDKALELVGYEDLLKERQARRERGDVKQLGIGLSTYIEMCGLAPSRILGQLRYAAGGWDAASLRILPTGKVEVAIGTTPHGQGHETTFAQIAADDLGVPLEDIDIIFGDTELVPRGMDTYGSRSLAVGGVAVHRACRKVLDKARKIAAHELEVAEDDLDFEAGRFTVKGAPEKGTALADLAMSAWTAHNLPDGLEPGLDALAIHDPENFVFPYGAHVCVVEVDTETGEVGVLKYVAEYDENGNLLTSSMTNYLVPGPPDVPSITVGRHVTPSTSNELGVKGVGETGTIASPPAVVNAVVDALSHLGVTEIDRPVDPETVWRAIQRAK